MSKKIFLIDIKKCNGCHVCQIACKDEHSGNDWTPIAKPQPETGQFWMKLEQDVRGTVPKVRVAYRPHLCMHCDNAPCMEACKVNGGIYKRKDGLVIIDPVKCTGCRNCVDACPYNVIYFNDDLNIAQKCTGCAHLIDKDWQEPRCADACPTNAIRFINEDEANDLISSGEVLKPGLKPRVYYLNLPKRFIAGCVYDPKEKEVIIGATCTLTDHYTGKAFTVKTDDFGDFWFENLSEGEYALQINTDGKMISFNDLDTREKDINLGDIAMT
jgi:tetrathionate reductase subunit B